MISQDTRHDVSSSVRACMEISRFLQQLDSNESKTVVVYGTSLTAGGAWAIAMESWFAEKYPGQVKFINSAMGGANSEWGISNLPEKVLIHNPDLVLLEFSYNDAIDNVMPIERSMENLDRMINGIRGCNPDVVMILQVMNTGWDAPNGLLTASRRNNLPIYNDCYREYSSKHDIGIIDHYGEWLDLSEKNPEIYKCFIPDGSHPTTEGSLAVTWEKIRKILDASKKDHE